ncbi:MAG: hypothetical protein ACRDN0_17945 [Trebonia sp.]
MTAHHDEMEKVVAVIDHMADALVHLDKTLTRYAEQGVNTELAREIRDRLRHIDNDVSRIDARLAYMQRVMLVTVGDLGATRPDITMTPAERIATMTDDELRAEQQHLHGELSAKSSARHQDEPEYGRLLEAFGATCAEANRRGMPDQVLEVEQ